MLKRQTRVKGAVFSSSEILVEADAWIQLSDPYDLPTITVTVNTVLALVRFCFCLTQKPKLMVLALCKLHKVLQFDRDFQCLLLHHV